MLTTWLIFIPIVGGLLLWLLPLRGLQAGGLALLVALGELALWIGAVANFDFSSSGLQYQTTEVWFEDLGVSYKVGLYDWSLWLVGLTVGVMAMAIAYGLCAGSGRARTSGSCSS